MLENREEEKTEEKESDIVKERVKKLDLLKAKGINPYPYKFDKKHNCRELIQKYSFLEKEQQTNFSVSIAGRIITMRRMGKATFMHILDETGKIQIYLREDSVKNYEDLKFYDIGDWIGIKGYIFKTKTGELTIFVQELELLCKSLKPLPEKFHGLQNVEIRYRKRYLDLIANPEVREVFKKRFLIIDGIREFLKKQGYMEVETPLLQPQYGGANARPFITHLNAYNMDVYLSISPELYLKRLLVGGFEKIFTICKNFRNEGVDKWHNPEFTMMECYAAYQDYEDMMKLVEEMVEYCCKKINGTTKIKHGDIEIDVKAPWKRMTMKDAIKNYANIDVDKISDEELNNLRIDYNLEIKGEVTRGKIIQALFEELCECHLQQPIHIIDHPVESTPLCKSKRNGESNIIERFESYILGKELCNAYSELNDPIKQRILLEKQALELRAGFEEAHPMDEDFIEAIEYGMPPAGGLGLGIDRLVLILTGAESIRDVLLFPFMKPEKF